MATDNRTMRFENLECWGFGPIYTEPVRYGGMGPGILGSDLVPLSKF